MEFTTQEREANLSAQFFPGDDEGALPCLTVAGVQVYGYVKDGTFHAIVDVEAADEWLLRNDETVPLTIAVNGGVVFNEEVT